MSRRATLRIGEISGYYARDRRESATSPFDLNVEGAREIALRLCDAADLILSLWP